MEQGMPRLASAGDGLVAIAPHRSLSAVARLWVGVALGVAAAAAVAVLWLRAANPGPEPEGHNWWLVAWIVGGAAYAVAGCLLVRLRPRGLLGVWFLVIGLAELLAAVAVQYRGYVLARSAAGAGGGWEALTEADGWARPLGAAVLLALVPWELIPVAWRSHRAGTAVRSVGAASAAVVALAGVAGWSAGRTAASWSAAVVGSVAVGVMAVSWRRAGRDDPLTGWLLAGTMVAWVAAVPELVDVVDVSLPGNHVVRALLLLATVPLVVVGALIGELRRSAPDGERLSHGTLQWLLLAASIALVYTGLVAGLGRLVGGDGPTWLLVGASGAIALAVEPARRRIRHHVDRLVFGPRDDPLSVVQRVVDHVGTGPGVDPLPALVDCLRNDLCLESVALDLPASDGSWERAAVSGTSTSRITEVLLRHRDGVVGRLVVGWGDGAVVRSRDRALLDQLAGPLALAVSWVRLAADLRRSSLAVVSAREEERRRLRRDLHDGVGPTLTGVSLGLRGAVRRLDRAASPDGADPSRELLVRLADEVDSVVGEIKRIVRDLRPTALDQLGLAGAVAEFTRTFDDDLEIHLALPPEPVPLPAAVEAAAYRIVTEALTNVVRHARAEQCWLSIEAGATVAIDVIDDGVGLDDANGLGVGLTAMRERAEELGGAFLLLPAGARGTHLHVDLPGVLP